MSFFTEEKPPKLIPPVYISTHPDSKGQQFDSYADLKKNCPECTGDGLQYEVQIRREVGNHA